MNAPKHTWRCHSDGDVVCDGYGGYYAEASRLTDHGFGDRANIYDWFAHIAEKPWSDFDSFVAAWIEACGLKKRRVCLQTLARSIRLGRKIVAKVERERLERAAQIAAHPPLRLEPFVVRKAADIPRRISLNDD